MLKTNIIVNQNIKFTTANIGCFLRIPLTKHNLAYSTFLARLQMNASLYFPTIQKQQEELLSLYDAQLEITPQLFGKELVLSYVINFVEPLEVLDPEYTYEEVAEKAALIIQHPLFDKELINFTKQQILIDQQLLLQSPTNYAMDRFFKLWYQDDSDYAYNAIGPMSEIEGVTAEKLQLFYNNLREMPMALLATARDSQKMDKVLQAKFKQVGLIKKFMVDDLVISVPNKSVNQVDNQNNIQAQLMLGYGYRQIIDYTDQITGSLLAYYLAGDQSSRLFTKVREELGAAYAIEASNYANNELFLISAGLDKNKISSAKEIITQEINEVKKGRIEVERLKKAKKSLLNLQLMLKDQPNYSLLWMLKDSLLSRYADIDRIDVLKKVTTNQVVTFAQNLFLNESYILK